MPFEESSRKVDMSQVLLELNKQNTMRDQTFAKIFDKFGKIEEATARAEESALEAKKHAATLIERIDTQDNKILPEIKQLIEVVDETTKQTNGKVKKLRVDVDEHTKALEPLTKEYRARILEEETAKLRRDGLLVLPRTVGTAIKAIYVKGINPGLKFLGIVAIAWPCLDWLWKHRIFWGH